MIQAKNLAKQKNAEGKDLHVPFHNARLDQYWDKCQIDSNYIITGGRESQRIEAQIRMLETYRRGKLNTGKPVVLLTTSDEMEAAFIHAGKSGRLGKVCVFSPRFRVYHALYGMDASRISQLLIALAKQKNYGDLAKLESYIDGVLEILSKYYPVSLAALQSFDKQFPENYQLIQLGQRKRVSEYHLLAIRGYPEGAASLRSLLKLLGDAYQNITYPECNNSRNILTSVRQGMAVCVNLRSKNPRVMDLAIAAELEQLMSSGVKFLLVLNDVPLYDAEGIYSQAALAKNTYGGSRLGICVENAVSWAGTVSGVTTSEKTLIENTRNVMLFHEPGVSEGDLEGILKCFGTYHRYEAMPGGHHGMLTPVALADDWHVDAVGIENRVMPRDLRGKSLLLKGHRGSKIELYAGISN